ncbi:O-antigen ligase [Deinococcus reticulitermitis]|uniref:O-antigen ligase n=1 Tax=Deinococcus reticulitermitis TaxID=856736 RepID=A0A1H6YWC1_9DEIO|nr:O-antigen ligase family protein [Deinococcus reticulitermitis]SEJ44666.1 O-antigen ligase [Deinococcus reticulitermitis]
MTPTSSSSALPRLLLLGLFGLPLVINPVISISFDDVYLAPKLWWIYGVILPAALLLLWQGRAELVRGRKLLLVLGGFFGLLLLSTLVSGAGWRGWWGPDDRADGLLMHLVYGTLLLAGWVWGRSSSDAPATFGSAVLIGGSLLALTNIAQQLGVLGVPGDGGFSGVVATPYGGTLGHRGYLGGALALLLPVAVTAVRREQVWTWGAVTLMGWAWTGSFSRGPWLAGAVGLIWLALWMRGRVPWRAWGAVVVGIALCAVTTQAQGGGRLFAWFGGDPASVSQGIADSSGRAALWNSALLGIEERPLLGSGTLSLWQYMNARPALEVLGEWGVREVAQVRRLNEAEADPPSFAVTHTDGKRELVVLGINKVHNEYLDYALVYGLPAALLFTALLVWGIGAARGWAPGLSAGLVAYAAYLLTWPEVVRFAPIAWFMLGMTFASGVHQALRTTARPGANSGTRHAAELEVTSSP